MRRRAVITGIGLLTPLGNDPKEFFENALKGVCGIDHIRKFDVSKFAVRIGGELRLENERLDLPAERLAEMQTLAQWCVLASRKAVRDSGINLKNENPYDVDIVVGVSTPPLDCITPEMLSQSGAGMASAPPATLIRFNPASAAVQISQDLGIQGEAVNVTTSCSSSTSAIGYAMRLIEHGEATCVLTGGADEGISPLFLGSFGNSSHLSHRNNDPRHASRPFDRLRDGCIISDAACMFVLEEYERAAARGARIYCEVSGYGATSDATSAFKLGPSEEPSARSLDRALHHARRNPEDIDYYSALGVSVPWLDIRETRMLKRVFGNHAPKVAISSIKSMMGHPMGAAGCVQAAACALAIQNGAVPPTINYDEPDPECDLDYVPNHAREMKVRNAMLYTLGNGGTNTALVLSAC